MTARALADAFVAALPSAPGDIDRDALGAAIESAWQAATTQWPGIAVTAEQLARELAARWVREDSSGRVDIAPFAHELALAVACIAGDPTAVRYFHRDMFDRVDRVLSRLGLSAADADDVKQDVRAKLLLGTGGDAKLAQYQGTGPLAQWVASVAGREALGSMRKRRPTEAIADDDLLAATDDPELAALHAQHRAQFKAAFQAAIGALEPRDRAVLRALVLDGRSVNDIAALYGIHRVTASRWVSEIRHALLSGTRKQLKRTLELDDASLDSAIRILDSNLELSLYRLLHDAE